MVSRKGCCAILIFTGRTLISCQSMSVTRDNHYVPQWYQEGFREPGNASLAYLDLKPGKIILPNGQQKDERNRFNWTPSKCFRQRDLYSTFFGSAVNDEIERRLFGEIDANGAQAVRAFIGTDQNEWIQRFENFFVYIDAQKLRTPKGLDWLKTQYPALERNELLIEMQGIRTLHCTIWSTGVREIVSAEDSAVKFITTDHPVTIYNHALPPGSPQCADPQDPGIALKASQTIFPLDRDHCLILTNLEYARDSNANPLEKRTFARNFQPTMVMATAMIRERKLTTDQVTGINYILKKRARRFVAAGREEWLHPEKSVQGDWRGLREILQPPEDELYHFGGEMWARYTDGHVHHQDEFGRTEKLPDILVKDVEEATIKQTDFCGCGSGKTFRSCCKGIPAGLRRTWKERSIRERNLLLEKAIVQELQMDELDWVEVRRRLTDDKISLIYTLYAHMWPRETDILQLLPKPDGRPRAVYTGSIHPNTISEFAVGAPLYFGELLVAHPFTHGRAMKRDISPIENPRAYRQEILKSILVFLALMPLVRAGLVELVPDPVTFDAHLAGEMLAMAKARLEGVKMDRRDDPRISEPHKMDTFRAILAQPPDAIRAQFLKSETDFDDTVLRTAIQHMREADPLLSLQEDDGAGKGGGGLITLSKLTPNFEMTMYLAQATGALIVTDSLHRWREIRNAVRWRPSRPALMLPQLTREIEAASFAFPNEADDTLGFATAAGGESYPALMRDIFRYVTGLAKKGPKPNFESGVSTRFQRIHAPFQAALARSAAPCSPGRIECAMPFGGIQDNTINRLLLMSSSEHHLPYVPLAFYIRRPGAGSERRKAPLPGLGGS